jgi:two-component system response regulator GlrR
MKISLAANLPMSENSVLLVEDNSNLRDSLQLFLDVLGVSYTSAEGGDEAIRILEKNRFEILITDLRGARTDGVKLLKWCRENAHTNPIILVSAQSDMSDGERVALSDSHAILLRKPIDILALERALQSAHDL